LEEAECDVAIASMIQPCLKREKERDGREDEGGEGAASSQRRHPQRGLRGPRMSWKMIWEDQERTMRCPWKWPH
jgi:hypothetical protein